MEICCAGKHYQNFSVKAENMPEFLRPLMLGNFQAVFSEKGLNPVAEAAELRVTLRYEQENITSDEPRDDFEGHLSPGGKVRYLAIVHVEMRDGDTDKLVWSGHIQRIHDVDAGEYMHAGKASSALQNAFRALLNKFPAKVYPDI